MGPIEDRSRSKVPERLAWAVDRLAPEPADRVLEIGCGTGVAAELIADRLATGVLTAIDRSAAAIAAAGKRNAEHIRAGRARFVETLLEAADFGGERFDRVLAVNVNRFWLKPMDESALWSPILRPGALVCLVYEPPPGQPTDRIAEACTEYFRASGFAAIHVRTADGRSGPLACIRAAWSGAGEPSQ